MRAVIQRVSRASVTVEGNCIGSIKNGLMILLGVEKGDSETDADYISNKIAQLRIFEDDEQKMNLSALDVSAEILIVSQFTLCGDARKGRRPGFDRAARPDEAVILYQYVAERFRRLDLHVETGSFGAEMAVELVNDGPVTILLDSRKTF